MLIKTIDKICQFFGFFMVIFMSLILIMIFGNVVLRYIFSSSITISEELSRWLFVWIVFLGAVVGLVKNLHLSVNVITKRLSGFNKKICLILTKFLMLAVFIYMSTGAWEQASINLENESPVMAVSLGWLYFACLVFASLASVIVALDLLRIIFKKSELSQAMIELKEIK